MNPKNWSQWEQMFEKYKLLEKVEANGFVDVTNDQFHALNIEPRMLTKHDHLKAVPPAMREQGLNILTLSARKWRIGHFDIFCTLPAWESPNQQVQMLSIPAWIEAIDPGRITGESGALNAALVSGMFNEFCEEQTLVPTVAGRASAGSFSFQVANSKYGMSTIDVVSPQIEIDAGYESDSALWLVEAKCQMPPDFNLRQLYYPFRTWSNRLLKKSIHTIFFTYRSNVFDFFEYQFEDPQIFSSGTLKAHRRFMLGATFPNKGDVVGLAKATLALPPKPIPPAPYPQADDFERVIDLVSFLMTDEFQTADSIAANYEFDPRQSDYYFSAARYLGLAEYESGATGDSTALRRATTLAEQIFDLPFREQRLKLAELVLGVPPVAAVYLEAVAGTPPTLARTQELLEASPVSADLSGSTLPRRSRTANAWVQWLLKLDGGTSV